ncbi:hypothetical protein A3H53_03440 [Candidatus Nomurabacteria bacterium RIFCSPLOWO2_02_FULL_40_10]|uniref:Methyltransferase type 11 domain-containing protein n=2 Tax=Candidatus Nomuraibacteriota TaxID=1752729 RepID=A0A1F6XVZ5_9BACT|nr:MAG: hypothetical protein A2642_00815 [Candidatus Nomurabacteria bacterium RIFCSPHIGHO2_01_FULL_39_10]OGI98178.1 MAG: hypothetical protein A3H53_03440 [Candidatus Nomurabacteria bacterium RIFCSPLOWO2_02_FULL_40_10]
MDESLKKFNKEVRRERTTFFRDWEDGDSDLETIAIRYRNLERILFSHGMDLKKVKVLELGSGNAVFLDYMKKQSVDAVGVDVRPRGGKSHHK